MAATQAQLVTRVLKNLHVLEAGETADANDDATVDDVIEQVQAELIELGLAYWALSAIPESVMSGLIKMVSADAAASFMDKAQSAAYERDRGLGERLIRRTVTTNPNTTDIPRIYF